MISLFLFPSSTIAMTSFFLFYSTKLNVSWLSRLLENQFLYFNWGLNTYYIMSSSLDTINVVVLIAYLNLYILYVIRYFKYYSLV